MKTVPRESLTASMLLLLFSLPAFAAFPICSKSTLSGKVEAIATPVRYYGKEDRRGHLSDKAADFQLSKAEIAQIKKSFGIIFCELEPGQKPYIGGAFLAENNCEVWTAAHNAQGLNGAPLDLNRCGFQNFEVPGKRTTFDSSSKRNILPWVADGSDGRSDRARLRLKDCVPGAKPFLVEDVRSPVGTEYMSVMAKNADMPLSNEPILAPGKVEDEETLPDGTRLLYTSNDQDTGASGGIDIVRSNGRLAVRAMHIQIKSSLKSAQNGGPANGEPYNRLNNFNVDLELSGPVYKSLKSP